MRPAAKNNDATMRVAKLVSYDKCTGEMRWLPRTPDMFKDGGDRRSRNNVCATWNSRYAGRVIGRQRDDGYVTINFNGCRVFAHRLAWAIAHGDPGELEIDHINGNRSDNRIENLRVATKLQNQQNRAIGTLNKSGFLGVNFHKARQKWVARLGVAGVRISLGYFDTPEDASIAYQSAKARHHAFQPVLRDAAQ